MKTYLMGENAGGCAGAWVAAVRNSMPNTIDVPSQSSWSGKRPHLAKKQIDQNKKQVKNKRMTYKPQENLSADLSTAIMLTTALLTIEEKQKLIKIMMGMRSKVIRPSR
jgi:hypothetical protein